MIGLLVGTRKGLWIVRGDAERAGWELIGPHHFGSTVHHAVLDPRDGKTLIAAARTGHLGPTIFRSEDFGESWSEASQPPAFRKAAEGEEGQAVHHVFWLTPGHASQPGTWYAGTSPHGLFKSEDAGQTWAPVAGFNDHPDLRTWAGSGGTPDGEKTHSILVDPRDPQRLFLGLSGGGCFESGDGGASWTPRNKGVAMDFAPPGDYEYGHDPHCVVQHPAQPDRLYMQNHCGLYRLDRPGEVWERIGDNLPREVGDVGFPVVTHPRDPDTAWVFPMDGTKVWPRTAPHGKPAVYRTRDAGASWQRLDQGWPAEQAWFTVKRQCMSADGADPLGVYVGTSSGELYASRDEGESWTRIAAHLPHIYCVEAVELP
ncbi:MAG TPA: glycosyl hydrolase [Planctomycetes bacterium]|nr:glycosyl hydrolase [Planctomycetota bacterium]